MQKFMFKFVVAICLAVSLGACAQAARPGALVAPLAQNNILPAGDPLVGSTKVGSVTGGQETSPLWTSEISNEAFKTALEQSLQLNTVLGDSNAPQTVNAELVSVDQPLIGASLTVTTTVAYKVTDSSGNVIFDEHIETPYTAAFSDAFLGVERLRLANEGSAQANIAAFIDKFIASSRARNTSS